MTRISIPDVFAPPVLFRGGPVTLPTHPVEEPVLNPMGFLTDNPERAGRITQLSAQTQELYQQAMLIDQELVKLDLTDVVDDVLKKAKQPDCKSYLEAAAAMLPEEERKKWDNALSDWIKCDNWIKLISFFVGAFGVGKAWEWMGLPEQASVREIASGVFLKKDPVISKSLSAAIRNWYSKMKGGPGIVPEMPAFQPMRPAAGEGLTALEKFEIDTAEQLKFKENLLARAEVRAAEEEVALGGRVLAKVGGFFGEVAGGVAFMVVSEVIIQNIEKGSYIEMEHAACITRLANKRLALVFTAVDKLFASLKVAHDLKADAEKEPDPAFRKHDMEKAEKECEKIAQELLKKLADCTYDKAWEVLHKEDVDYKHYLDDDLKKEELIKQTVETIAKRIKDKH